MVALRLTKKLWTFVGTLDFNGVTDVVDHMGAEVRAAWKYGILQGCCDSFQPQRANGFRYRFGRD